MTRALGVFREPQNSPGREDDDALILRRVFDQLALLGMDTRLATPEEFDGIDLSDWDLLIPMCESYPRLKRLNGAAPGAGTELPRIINAPQAVLNCYRTAMVPLLDGVPELGFPRTEVRAVKESRPGPSAFKGGGLWVKRGDVHNTCDRDVVFARDAARLEEILEDFAAREITHYLLQSHVEGDLIKFYGVGPGRWFTWFYHDPAAGPRTPFEPDLLARAAAAGARRLGLEVFGGDAIVSSGGEVAVIDLNSWPSFARVRAEAAVQIARHAHSAALQRRRTGSLRQS